MWALDAITWSGLANVSVDRCLGFSCDSLYLLLSQGSFQQFDRHMQCCLFLGQYRRVSVLGAHRKYTLCGAGVMC
jgi:hypothetical protein